MHANTGDDVSVKHSCLTRLCCLKPGDKNARPLCTPGKYARKCYFFDLIDLLSGRGVGGLAAHARHPNPDIYGDPPNQMVAKANDSMVALAPQEVHDRLSSRWSVQTTPLLLSAGINLSLSFGSEYVYLNQGFLRDDNEICSNKPRVATDPICNDENSVYHFFVFVSAAAFALNMMAFSAFVRAMADLGRVPNNRIIMKEYLTTCDLSVADQLGQQAMLMTLLQVGMAFYGMNAWAFVGFVASYVWCLIFMWYRTRNEQTRLGSLYDRPSEPGPGPGPDQLLGGPTFDRD